MKSFVKNSARTHPPISHDRRTCLILEENSHFDVKYILARSENYISNGAKEKFRA